VRRSLVLFAFGLFVSNDGSEGATHWRIPGVLQRFGVSYFFVSLMAVFLPHERPEEGEEKSGVSDVLDHKWEWITILGILGLWHGLTFGLDVPGCGRGYLGPGGIGDNGNYQNCTGGAAGYIDQQLLGKSHIYQSPTCKMVYQTGAYDPEGTLGCMTSIVLTYLGLQSGRIIVYYKTHEGRLKRWFSWSLFLGVLAIILCWGQRDGGPVPINKNLWSSSFILAQGASGFFGLAVLYVVIDIKKLWNGSPLFQVGMNSILVYMGSECLQYKFPFSYDKVYTESTDHGPILALNMGSVCCWMLIAYYLHYSNLFFSV